MTSENQSAAKDYSKGEILQFTLCVQATEDCQTNFGHQVDTAAFIPTNEERLPGSGVFFSLVYFEVVKHRLRQ